MPMAHRIVAYLSLALFMLSGMFLGGCANARAEIPNAVIGKWEHAGHVYEYRDNGRLLYDGKAIDYEIIEEGKIRINSGYDSNAGEDQMDTQVFDYSFNDDGTLTMNGVKFYPASNVNGGTMGS